MDHAVGAVLAGGAKLCTISCKIRPLLVENAKLYKIKVGVGVTLLLGLDLHSSPNATHPSNCTSATLVHCIPSKQHPLFAIPGN